VFHTVEEFRVSYKSESNRVVVAWVQADNRNLPPDFPTAGTLATNHMRRRFEHEIGTGHQNGRSLGVSREVAGRTVGGVAVVRRDPVNSIILLPTPSQPESANG